MAARHPGPETRAFIASDSDSDAAAELGVPQKKKNRRLRSESSGISLIPRCIQSKCPCVPFGSKASFVLIVSLVLNAVLLITVISVHNKKGSSICVEIPNHNPLGTPAAQASSKNLSSASAVNDASPLSPSSSHTSPSLSSSSSSSTTSPSSSKSSSVSPREPPAAGSSTSSSGNATGCGVTSRPVTCGTGTEKLRAPVDEAPVDEGYVNVFRDLSEAEIRATVQYLMRQTDLAISVNSPTGNQISGIEVYIPYKASTLAFLDSTGPQPPRQALVSLAMSREYPPIFRQYVVGPLPSPREHRINPRMTKDVPLSKMLTYRFVEVYRFVIQTVQQRDVARILRESFGSQVCTGPGSDHCIMFLGQKISFGLMNTTSFSFVANYDAEIPTIHTLPFQLVVSEETSPGGPLAVRWVYYAGASFPTLGHLVAAYNDGTVFKVTRTYPGNVPGESSVAGSMNLRRKPSPAKPHPPPQQYEPKGSRFSVVDQHVKYLEWSFDVRNSIESGMQVWDVRWSGERIVYELSLQEIVVLYAGANPSSTFAHLSDSAFGLGDNARGLVPGVDCPHHAKFLSTWAFNGRRSGVYAERLANTVCVFEHNSGVPLRRHKIPDEHKTYGALVDHYLVVRTIIVEYNYDYIVDVVFHANGALETRVYATGYIMSQWFNYGEMPFGFKVSDDIVGSIHHHLFNFKVDMDVGGASNRYETLDFTVDNRSWPWLSIMDPSATTKTSSASSSSSSTPTGSSHASSSSSSTSRRTYQQIAFKHHPRKTEKEALYVYNFDKPKYHVFFNDKQKNQFGNVRSYRLVGRGFSKQLLPEDHPALRSRKWAQYCIAVTQHKEHEAKSSSVFSMFDADDPVVDFDSFHRDDENIEDKDLVAWVTVGMHHIPHTEDIPNTPTVGTEASILLMPYNYFPECPSARSRDAVRMQGTRVDTYGTPTEFTCLPPVYGPLRQSRRPSGQPIK